MFLVVFFESRITKWEVIYFNFSLIESIPTHMLEKGKIEKLGGRRPILLTNASHEAATESIHP